MVSGTLYSEVPSMDFVLGTVVIAATGELMESAVRSDLRMTRF
jgi:hypothetical protein